MPSFLYEQTKKNCSVRELTKPFGNPFFSAHDPPLPENSPQQHSPAPLYNSKQGKQHKETIAWFISMHWLPGGDAPSFLLPPELQSLIKLGVYQFSESLLGPCKERSCQTGFVLGLIFISYRALWVLGFDQI